MLFHQSAAGAQGYDSFQFNAHKSHTQLRADGVEWWRTCTIPVRKIVSSLRALFPVNRGKLLTEAKTEVFIFARYKKNSYLFLQCQAQTTVRMRAVRTMTNTGTRTAASATSESKDNKHHTTTVSPGDQNKLFALKSDAPLLLCGGIVVFLMSGVCVVWPRRGGRFVPPGGGGWREVGNVLCPGLMPVLGLAA